MVQASQNIDALLAQAKKAIEAGNQAVAQSEEVSERIAENIGRIEQEHAEREAVIDRQIEADIAEMDTATVQFIADLERVAGPII